MKLHSFTNVMTAANVYGVPTDLESQWINFGRGKSGILLMVREKWRVSSEFRICCLFLLKKWKHTLSACY